MFDFVDFRTALVFGCNKLAEAEEVAAFFGWAFGVDSDGSFGFLGALGFDTFVSALSFVLGSLSAFGFGTRFGGFFTFPEEVESMLFSTLVAESGFFGNGPEESLEGEGSF